MCFAGLLLKEAKKRKLFLFPMKQLHTSALKFAKILIKTPSEGQDTRFTISANI